MTISAKFWEYKGTQQHVWHRRINGTDYGFVHDLVNGAVMVLRYKDGEWARIHKF